MRDISVVFGGSGTRTWDTRSTGIKVLFGRRRVKSCIHFNVM